VTGSRQYSADLEQGGMDIPCTYTFSSEFFQESSKPEKSIKLAIKKGTIKEVSSISELSVFDKQLETKAECENQPSPASEPASDNNTHIKANDIIDMLSESEEESDEPPLKKFKHSVDFECIIMGDKLTDLEINTAQRLLKGQFPDIIGLKSTLLQERKDTQFSKQSRNYIQIIHYKERDHWITATTIDCDSSVIKIYDSLFCTVDDSTVDIISELLHMPEPPKIKVTCLQ